MFEEDGECVSLMRMLAGVFVPDRAQADLVAEEALEPAGLWALVSKQQYPRVRGT